MDRIQKLRQIRATNLLPPGSNDSSAGDGSLKKNTAMVNKLKSIDNSGKLVDELRKLKFDKFIQEMTNSITSDAVFKVRSQSDAASIIEVASVLHQRSVEFGPRFASELIRCLLPPTKPLADIKAEQTRQIHQRAVFRVFIEAVLAGIISPEVACAIIPTVIAVGSAKNAAKAEAKLREWFEKLGGTILWLTNALLKGDSGEHINCHLVILLAKSYGHELFTSDEFIDPLVRETLVNLLNEYTKTVFDRLEKEHKALEKMRKQNQDHVITRGELTELHKGKFEAAEKSYYLVKHNAESLAESLNLELPALRNAEDADSSGFAATIVDPNEKFTEHLGKDWHETPWEDEECRIFYADIPDLLNFVPKIYLSVDNKPKKKKRDRRRQEDDLDDEFMDEVDQDLLNSLEANIDRENGDRDAIDSKTSTASTTPLDAFVLRMQSFVSKELVDEAAVEFCNLRHLNPTLAESKLTAAFIEVPRHRIDLLPFYARFIAIIQPFMPEIGNTVIACLHSEFRRRFRKQTQFHLEHRVKCVRFLGELAKFRVCPTHIIFYCFKRLIQPESSGVTFDNYHAEVACVLLESCGRYMLKIPEIAAKFQPLVEIMKKKVKVANLDARVSLVFENALIIINPRPPADTRISKRRRTPLEWFIRDLIYDKMRRGNVEQILKMLRSLPWSQAEHQALFQRGGDLSAIADPPCTEEKDSVNVPVNTGDILSKIFLKVWKIKFPLLQTMASLLAGLVRYHPLFVSDIVDGVLEQLRLGMEELTHFRYQQRRISTVHYLGQLCNYQIISPHLIVDSLYLLVYFGHQYDKMLPAPVENPICLIDSPYDSFRIRLSCELLRTCRERLVHNSVRPLLNRYLAVFQCYILSKDQTVLLPEVKFEITDTFRIFWPLFCLCSTFDEAKAVFQRVEIGKEATFSDSTSAKPAELEVAKPLNNNNEDAVTPLDESDSDESDGDSSNTSSDFDSSISNSSKEGSGYATDDTSLELSEEESHRSTSDEEFTKELQKVFAESIESRRGEKRVLDLALPVQIRTEQSELPADSDHMKFAVITKRSGRGPMKVVEVPLSSRFATLNLSNQEAKEAEKKELKRLVLQLESARE